MIQKFVILICIFVLSSCQQFVAGNHKNRGTSFKPVTICPISSNEILSCMAYSTKLSEDEIISEFDSLVDSLDGGHDEQQLNRLLCLSLHNKASKKQLEKGKTILEDILKKDQCQQPNLEGLLLVIERNLQLHKKYLNKSWKLHLAKKETSKTKISIEQEFDDEIISYQRRIQDLEKQVLKLKEIESMLDKNVNQ